MVLFYSTLLFGPNVNQGYINKHANSYSCIQQQCNISKETKLMFLQHTLKKKYLSCSLSTTFVSPFEEECDIYES
jgi:hypothetical protein